MHEGELKSDARRQRTIAAVATFAALMHAYERRELTAVAAAQAELDRLGVVVRFTRLKIRDREGDSHD